jgi:hypothetical protein
MPGEDSYRWAIAPGREQFEPFVKKLSATFEEIGNTIYKERNVLKTISMNERTIVVKSFVLPNLLNRYLYRWARKSKARRAYENAVKLTKLKVATPTPIGYIEYHRGMCLAQSFYIYDEWPADNTVREVITDPQHPDRDRILSALGEFAWQLHSKLVHFRDFSPGNILVRWGSDRQLCLVDINRISFEVMPLKKRMRTFARLWADDNDLLTIVAAYARASGDDAHRASRLALHYSKAHKQSSQRKESIKTLLKLH